MLVSRVIYPFDDEVPPFGAARHQRQHGDFIASAGRASTVARGPMRSQALCVNERGVLLVDDDAAFRVEARQLLAAWGYDVRGEAGTGAEALREAERTMPWLVLLDVQLPDIDGMEVAGRLRALPSPPLVVLISAREAIDYGRRLAESGALAFLSKSRLSMDALRAILPKGSEEGT